MTRLAFVWALAASLMTFAALPAMAADDALSAQANQAFLAANAKKPGVHVLSNGSGLQYRIIQNGFGKRPGATDTVVVYYTGSLINGKVFDGTSPGLPATFPVADLIPGWSQALQLMREGDHWQLVIPAILGYGNRGAPDGSIPPNQTLVFDLRLISTKPAPKRGDPDYRPDPTDKDADQQP